MAIHPDIASRSYQTELGALIGNLHTLEFLLRSSIHHSDGYRAPAALPPVPDFSELTVGDLVPLSAWSDYSSLGQLIDQFNSKVRRMSLPGVDRSLVDLRDAIAHGRVFASSQAGGLRALKFDKPIGGLVRVSFAANLSVSWLLEQQRRVAEAMAIADSELMAMRHAHGDKTW